MIMDVGRDTKPMLLSTRLGLAISGAPLRGVHRVPDITAPPQQAFACGISTLFLVGLFVFLGTPLAAQSTTLWPQDDPRPILSFAQPVAAVAPVPQAVIPSSEKGTMASSAAHTKQPAPKLPEFEVASVKPVDMTGQLLNSFTIHPGGRMDMQGWELTRLISVAFNVERVTGGADWTRVQKFDIRAVPPNEMQASIKDVRSKPGIADPHLRQMLQALLIGRFQLRFHHETTTSNVYLLQRGATPPTLRPTSIDGSRTTSWAWQFLTRDHGRWVLQGATMPTLARILSGALETPVLDETGLTGTYDYKQRGADDDAPVADQDLVPSLLRFVAELKLKLRKAKRPVDVFMIDGAARPLPY